MMPYCQLCDKQSPCRHWPSEGGVNLSEARDLIAHDAGLDEQIDNAIRGKLDASKVSVGADQFPGTLVVDGTEYPAPETVVLNGYLYRRDDSASVL